jgi:hypothetical protein
MFSGVNEISLLLRLRELSGWTEIWLTFTLCEARPPKVAQMFCLLDQQAEGRAGCFEEMVVFVRIQLSIVYYSCETKRGTCLFFNFRFDFVILILLLLWFRPS